MRTALLALVGCAMLMSMRPQNPASPPPSITLNPAPPTAGQTAEVGWTGTGPKTLQLTWDPAGAGPAEILVPKGGTVKLSIPSNAAGLVIHDPSPGGADDFATPIFP